MASHDKPDSPAPATPTTTSEPGTTARADDALKPFQEAAARYLQASLSAHESAITDRAKAHLDFHEQARSIEQDAYRSVMDATRKHMDRVAQPAQGSVEEIYSARLQAQLGYEKEVREVYADAEAKLRALAHKAFTEGGGDTFKRVVNQRQDAYQAYVADLQNAWSNTKTQDPQVMAAIASHILCTINMS